MDFFFLETSSLKAGSSIATVDGPAKSESPVENAGKHPIILDGLKNHPKW